MRVLDLTIKDIKQVIRDWKSALFLIVMPIIFTLFFGFIFDPIYSTDPIEENRLPAGFINQDTESVVSSDLINMLMNSDIIQPILLDNSDLINAKQMVEEGKLAAVVLIPENYGDRLLNGHEVKLEVVADQNTLVGQTASTALETVVDRLLSGIEVAQLSAQTYDQEVGFETNAARDSYRIESLAMAISAWNDPPLTIQVEQAQNNIAGEGVSVKMSGFVQSSSGMIVQFAVFGLITSAMIIVLERKNKVLQRLLTTPIRRSEVIAGHILAMFLVIFVQETILVLLGQFGFGVNYLRQPWAILLMMLTLALWASSLGLLIGAISKREEQVIVLSLIAMFIFAAMGGAWFPLEITGKTFATIGHIMPTAWAIDGFQNIIVRGLNASSVLLPAAILLIYATLFFSLAVWRFRFE